MAKRKSTSRASRAADIAGSIGSAVSNLEDIKSSIEAFAERIANGEEIEDGEIEEETLRISDNVQDIQNTSDGIQELHDEIESWHDNMQGTNLENTQKYSDLEDCMGELDNVISSIDGISDPEIPEKYTEESLNDLAGELEDLISEAESAQSDLENVNFPGMY